MEEFVYQQGWWTSTFRKLIKGSLGITENYNRYSNESIINSIDEFVYSIAFVNYINDNIPTSSSINVNIPIEIVKEIHIINKQFVNILMPTHVVCWGKEVYNHLIAWPEIRMLKRDMNLGIKGFESSLIAINGRQIRL